MLYYFQLYITNSLTRFSVFIQIAFPKATLITITKTFIKLIMFKDDANTLALFVLRNFHGIREVIDPKIIHNLKIGPQRCPREKNLNNIAPKWRQIFGLPGRHMYWPRRCISLLSNSILKDICRKS